MYKLVHVSSILIISVLALCVYHVGFEGGLSELGHYIVSWRPTMDHMSSALLSTLFNLNCQSSEGVITKQCWFR
jgi:hypothetical protein